MHALLAVVIFLLGVIAGTLVLSYFSRESATEQLIQLLGHLASEHRKHADGAATVLLKERRIATHAILKELRAAALERRELMRLAGGDCSGSGLCSCSDSGASSDKDAARPWKGAFRLVDWPA